MTHRIRLTGAAEADLKGIFLFVAERASAVTAQGYVERILSFLTGFDLFPERGARRDDIRPGLRVVGFERRVSIAFVVEADEVVVLRVLYAGRQFSDAESF